MSRPFHPMQPRLLGDSPLWSASRSLCALCNKSLPLALVSLWLDWHVEAAAVVSLLIHTKGLYLL